MELAPLIAIQVQVEPPHELGSQPAGERRAIVFSGGTFTGRDGLTGVVAAGGADWQTLRPDGVLDIDAHYALVTEQGEHIEVRSTGVRDASPEVARRIAAGEPVDPSEYYFRTHIRLTTSAPRLEWMNRLIAVSNGRRDRSVVHIDVHEVR
ncbi:MAG: DUF3237 domain-containing protein [Actinobacteria bacterium]|nr:DUF3237 domain-containing protein [Actinomycetota bacterium]